MSQTPLKVAGHEFELVRLRPGYNRHEVDRFLQTGEDEIQSLAAENAALRSKIEELEAAAAEEPAAQAVEEAEPGRQEAARILDDAGRQHAHNLEEGRNQAAELLEQARQKARDLTEEAEKTRAETMEALEAQEAELVRTGERLHHFEQDYRLTLKGLMAGGLDEVNAGQSD